VKFLFITYCFGPQKGQALIGVYKRGLRIALELCERGHEVVFFCTGRENFHDELTARAEQQLEFVDLPCFNDPIFEIAEANRQLYLKNIAEINPDIVVIGEVPLVNTLLESTQCAVELGIPVILLDNAFQPVLEAMFCWVHGPMMDGLILTGPSSFHQSHPPAYLCQVPPYIEAEPQAARSLLTGELGLRGDSLITIMAYDLNVERLGMTLMGRLGASAPEAVFLSRDVEGCEQRLSQLPIQVREKIRVLGPQPERLLFGLLQLSRFAVGKCAFMQVTECLSLRTPIIGFYFKGDFSLNYIPHRCRAFAHATSNLEADGSTVAAARRFLKMDKDKIAALHNGEFGAASKAADFLESLALQPRHDTLDGCARLGFSEPVIRTALGSQNPSDHLVVQQLRATRVRILPQQDIYSLLCRYTLDDEEQFVRLWGRLFKSRRSAKAELADASAPASGRCVMYYSLADRILIERDIGEAALPDLEAYRPKWSGLRGYDVKFMLRVWLSTMFPSSNGGFG
jgi:hypothetical protein